jgi:hydroxypyruvate isomerase
VRPVDTVTGAMWLAAEKTLTRIAALGEREGVVFCLENLIQLIRDSIGWIGEIQVADVPGRCEPGTGEISYPAIAGALHRAGYTGVVGLEGFASRDSDYALQRFRLAFTEPAGMS